MSPPIRDGSGDSIGSIRLGDGSEISEVRTGAGDVLFSGVNEIASRDPDNVTNTNNSRRGIEIRVGRDWPSIGVKISSLTPSSWSASTAEIIRMANGSTKDTANISGLTAGDVFTFDNANLLSGNDYAIVAYNSGNDYVTAGDSSPNFPYKSSNTSNPAVQIVGGIKNATNSADPTNFVSVGTIGL